MNTSKYILLNLFVALSVGGVMTGIEYREMPMSPQQKAAQAKLQATMKQAYTKMTEAWKKLDEKYPLVAQKLKLNKAYFESIRDLYHKYPTKHIHNAHLYVPELTTPAGTAAKTALEKEYKEKRESLINNPDFSKQEAAFNKAIEKVGREFDATMQKASALYQKSVPAERNQDDALGSKIAQ